MSFFHRRQFNDEDSDSLRGNYDDKLGTQKEAKKLKKRTFRSKIFHFFKFLKLNRHHKIQRWLLYYVLAISLLFAGIIISVNHSNKIHIIQSETLSSYNNDNIKFSKSDVSMRLHKIQITDSKKTAFIPFRFSSMDNISTNSNNYSIFIYPIVRGDLKYRAQGQLILFGDTGRGVLVIHSSTKIANQRINVVIENKKNMDTDKLEDQSAEISQDAAQGIDKIQKKFDALTFKINPAARNTKVVKNLSDGSNTVINLYKYFFADPEIKKIHLKQEKDKKKIKIQENKAHDLAFRLKSRGYRVPDEPVFMKDNWRPFDATDEKGNLLNTTPANLLRIKRMKNPDYSQAQNDPDTPNYPSILTNEDGSTTDDSLNNNYNNNDSDNDNDSDNKKYSDSETWQNLQSTWDEVHSLKRDLYVKKVNKIVLINKNTNYQNNEASIGSIKHFKGLANQ